jgi:glycosyltransferase 2 family protein
MRISHILARWVFPLIGAGLAIGILFWLYKGLDFGRFAAALRQAEPGWLVALVLGILVEQLLRAWKWRQILYDLKSISTGRLFGAILAGYGAATLVPLGISPLVRSWLVARLEGLRFASVLVTAAIERFIDGIVFAAITGLVASAGGTPPVDGDLRIGLGATAALGFGIFSASLWLVFRGRGFVERGDTPISRLLDWLASRGGARLANLRTAITAGIVWPREGIRRLGIVAASVAMKAVAATHLLWAGLAVGVTLGFLDYLFLMVFAGFALVLARFIRVPGGFIVGSGFALNLLGVPEEQALAMILFTHVLTIVLVVGVGLAVLWRSGIKIRSMPRSEDIGDGTD